jgi:clorobiocin biosynthesis protein CloN4
MLHDLVIAGAQRAPDSAAVVSAERSLTYRELDELAGRFAGALRDHGVAPGDRVIIWAGKSAAAIAVMQGVLRIGAVYVPVTAVNPAARVARIATDCRAALLLADDALAGRFHDSAADLGPGPAVAVLSLDELLEAAPAAGPAPYRHSPDDLAYILYTSGSTGSPKGVCLSHRNALAFVDWAVELLGVGPHDRLANHAPFNFDLSVFDLYGAFRAGACVYPVPAELGYAPRQLTRFIRDRAISIWYSVPSVLSMMMRDGGLLDGEPPVDLRAVVFAGEPFPVAHAHELRRAWPKVRMLNWYGPTETNVCTSYELTEDDLDHDRPLPIGAPASGATIRLSAVDGSPPPGPAAAQAGAEGEIDAEGEIVVSGPTVMLGYWGGTAQRGPYRTGDLGRLGPQGVLEYLGRIDQMVKVRGHRIEPGEIEAVIGAHPGVSDVAVVVAGSGLAARLHAVLTSTGAAPSLLAIKRWCADRLPTYMVIDSLHVVDALPLTANGKVNRAGLVATIEAAR